VFGVNAKGAFLCSKYAVKAMEERGGSIVHIGSTHAFGASPFYSAYGASKAAMYSLSSYLAKNYASKRIRSNCITVGWVATEGELGRLKGMKEDLERIAQGRIPLGRLQTGDDIAKGAIYLLSDESAMVTDSNIKITGGFTP
jgi:NAD(P)-dependent dehydrogenase (short-subunit alcohol dehydrogenase family)